MVHDSTSPPLTRRQRQREERIHEIVEASLRLVEEAGLEALTIQRLARDLGWAVGAMYRYFPSKQALLAEVERRVIGIFQLEIRNAIDVLNAAAGDEPPRPLALARLLEGAHCYQRLASERAEAFRLIALIVGDPRPLLDDADGARVMAAVAPLLADIAEVFAEAADCEALEAGDAQTRTLIYWMGLHGVVQSHKLWRFDVHSRGSAELLETMACSLLRGFGAQPEELEQARGICEACGTK